MATRRVCLYFFWKVEKYLSMARKLLEVSNVEWFPWRESSAAVEIEMILAMANGV
jgi:hypothetical protein